MKTTTLKSITIGLFLSVILVSCSKKDNITTKSQTELLTQKSWKFEMYGLDENNNGVIEESENGMLACETDDVYTFNANGTGVYAGGALQCSIGEPPTIDFGWTFSNNGTELAIFAAPEKINKLDENILEVYYIDQNSQGQPVKYIRRFQH
jgi:hypothetical protein